MAAFTQQLLEQEAELRRLQEEERRLVHQQRRGGERDEERRRDLERVRMMEESQRREVRRGRDDRERRRGEKSREEMEIDRLVRSLLCYLSDLYPPIIILPSALFVFFAALSFQLESLTRDIVVLCCGLG